MRTVFLFVLLTASLSVLAQNKAYYINAAGDDANPGTIDQPWKTVTPANSFDFEPGDTLFVAGGQTFGKLQLQRNDGGLTLMSYNGRATLSGLFAYNVGDITIDGVDFYGPGATGNMQDGIKFYMDSTAQGDLNNLFLRNLNVSNFGGNGILIGAWTTSNGYNNVEVSNSNLNGNGIDGFASYGNLDEINHTNLHIFNVKAYQNYGHTEITSTRTGSGVVVGGFDGGIVENCEAYENGKNNRNNGGGPQGFWCYNSRNIIIQYCVSHDNRAGWQNDGSGFDIDGGSQNCILQYNYSYNNDGPGYAFYEYGSTNQFTNNVIRYNISQNDARRNYEGGIMMWAKDTFNRVKNSQIYNNTIYVTPSATAPSGYPFGIFFKWTNFKNISFYNNIVYTTGTTRIFSGSVTGTTFSNNNYYTLGGTVNFSSGGIKTDPQFVNAGGGKDGYLLKGTSPAINAGKTAPATQDFLGTALPFNLKTDIGAYEMKILPPKANAGPDQFSNMPANSLVLNGIGTDTDGTIQRYAWTKTAGPSQYTIATPDSASTAITDLAEGYYTFRLTVTDNDGAVAYDDIQVIIYPGAPPAGSKFVNVTIYGGTNPYKNTAWNNWNVTASLFKNALLYSDATVSTVNAALSATSGVNDNGSTYGGTMAPPAVLRYTTVSSATRTLTVTGLSPTSQYRIELYASRNTTGSTTSFTIGTTVVTVVTDKNKLYKASFINLTPDATGTIVVTIKKVAGNNYLNGFVLTELPAAITNGTKASGPCPLDVQSDVLQVQAFPNPSTEDFSLHVGGGNKTVQIRIVNEAGNIVEWKQAAANSTIRFGQTYRPGVYYAEVVQGNGKKIIKLVKTAL